MVRRAVTHDQEFYEAILQEQHAIRLLLERIAERLDGVSLDEPASEVVCRVCGKAFKNERALRAHERIHGGRRSG